MRGRGGQTVVELLLILPVFMFLIFFILEIGNIAYHTIVAHHAAYELSRVGALSGVTKHSGASDTARMDKRMDEALTNMFKGNPNAQVKIASKLERTSSDPQGYRHLNEDLVVTLTYTVKLAFPGTNFIFADKPKRLGQKAIVAQVRMPIDRALLN